LVVVNVDKELVCWVADRVDKVGDLSLELDKVIVARVKTSRLDLLLKDDIEGVSD